MTGSRHRRLRSGFTTGACAAAGAKAALLLLLGEVAMDSVAIPFPDGGRHGFQLLRCQRLAMDQAEASVIKDAGDDPDVTNGAEIMARVRLETDSVQGLDSPVMIPHESPPPLRGGGWGVGEGTTCRAAATSPPTLALPRRGGGDSLVQESPVQLAERTTLVPNPAPLTIRFVAGEGVGTITKPGLALAVGEPAINPGPRAMIRAALEEAFAEAGVKDGQRLAAPLQITVTIAIPKGRELAHKTLNERLGIVGGLSILGTTGIVRPVSAEAWTATILASMAVAKETGCREIVLSTGRTSEKAVQTLLGLPVEAYAMMGDYLHFSLEAASRHGFTTIHLAGMWAKVLKAAMAIPQTHVRHGALEVREAAEFIGGLAGSTELARELADANTAREIHDRLLAGGRLELVTQVCRAARTYAEGVAGRPVSVYLVTSATQVVCHV